MAQFCAFCTCRVAPSSGTLAVSGINIWERICSLLNRWRNHLWAEPCTFNLEYHCVPFVKERGKEKGNENGKRRERKGKEKGERKKYAIGWHCPRWLRHLFSSLVVKKSFPRKTFVEHTSPLLFQRFDDRNVRSRKKEFKLKMG